MHIKVSVTVFFKLKTIGPRLEPPKEILCILVAQVAAKLTEVKVAGQKKWKTWPKI